MNEQQSEVVVRPLEPSDVEAADEIMRTAFGTFMGVPDPVQIFGDAQFVRTRYAAEPKWAFAADVDGALAGSVFATRWGSFAFFGPLTVRVDLWDRGVASRLMEPVVDLFDRWGVSLSGLYTFAQSAKHVGLYNKFGFWPQQLTAIMAAPVAGGAAEPPHTLRVLAAGQRDAVIATCGEITGAIFEGLDVAHEIRAVVEQGLGDVVLLDDGSGLVGFAICHCGAGEAGSTGCFVKFAAVRPGSLAGEHFSQLLDCVARLASSRGVERIMAGTDLARRDAYRRMRASGFRSIGQGVRMHRPDAPGYSGADVYVIDDLR